MNPKLSLLWAVLVFFQSGLSHTQHSPLSASDRHPPVASVEIPFQLQQGYLIVAHGSLGNLSRLNFLIDTGTDPTAVDVRIAKKLRLTGRPHELVLLNEITDVRETVLPSLQLGPIRAESVPAMIQDLSAFEAASGERIDAIIGFGVLSRSSFSINYQSKKIVFGPIESLPFTGPLDIGPEGLTVQFDVQDKPVRLLVDTGSCELILFKCKVQSRLDKLTVGDAHRLLNNGGSQQKYTEVRLPGLRLAANDFGPQKALSADGDANCGLPFDGVVGATALGLKWIAFDFEHRNLGWRR